MTANDDIAGCLEGVNRLVRQMQSHANKICDTHEEAVSIAHRLANP